MYYFLVFKLFGKHFINVATWVGVIGQHREKQYYCTGIQLTRDLNSLMYQLVELLHDAFQVGAL